MNNHINQNRRDTRLAEALVWGGQFKVVDRDAMPKEVATEILCSPKARTTNRERKTCNDARSTIYTSIRVAVPEEEKVANKLKGRNWLQLNVQLSRTIEARETAQRHFLFLRRQANKLDSRNEKHVPMLALLNRQLAALDLHAAALDSLRDTIDGEFDRRKTFCASLQQMVPSVAKKLRRKLCGYEAK